LWHFELQTRDHKAAANTACRNQLLSGSAHVEHFNESSVSAEQRHTNSNICLHVTKQTVRVQIVLTANKKIAPFSLPGSVLKQEGTRAFVGRKFVSMDKYYYYYVNLRNCLSGTFQVQAHSDKNITVSTSLNLLQVARLLYVLTIVTSQNSAW
jgi:hypothetical protein